MRVFVTGASGHIGAALVPDLLQAGHEVVGLARSDSSAAVLEQRGADVVRGDLADLDGLREAASAADGVIHLAFDHDAHARRRSGERWRLGPCARHRRSPTGSAATGKAVRRHLRDADAYARRPRPRRHRGRRDRWRLPRVDTENFVVGLADARHAVVGACAYRRPCTARSTARLHPHADRDRREHGRAGYVGDGANRWPAAHTLDVARLYRLALEGPPPDRDCTLSTTKASRCRADRRGDRPPPGRFHCEHPCRRGADPVRLCCVGRRARQPHDERAHTRAARLDAVASGPARRRRRRPLLRGSVSPCQPSTRVV